MTTLTDSTFAPRGYSTTNFEFNQVNRQAVNEVFNSLILERNPYLVLSGDDTVAEALNKGDAQNKEFKLRTRGGYYVQLQNGSENNVTLNTDKGSGSPFWFVYNQASGAWLVNVTGDDNIDYVVHASDSGALTDSSGEVTPLIPVTFESNITANTQQYGTFSESDSLHRALFRVTASVYNKNEDGQRTIELRNVHYDPAYSWLVIDNDASDESANGFDDPNNLPEMFIHKRPSNPVSFQRRAIVGEEV